MQPSLNLPKMNPGYYLFTYICTNVNDVEKRLTVIKNFVENDTSTLSLSEEEDKLLLGVQCTGVFQSLGLSFIPNGSLSALSST